MTEQEKLKLQKMLDELDLILLSLTLHIDIGNLAQEFRGSLDKQTGGAACHTTE